MFATAVGTIERIRWVASRCDVSCPKVMDDGTINGYSSMKMAKDFGESNWKGTDIPHNGDDKQKPFFQLQNLYSQSNVSNLSITHWNNWKLLVSDSM